MTKVLKQLYLAILLWDFLTKISKNSFHIGLGLHIYHLVHSKQILHSLWQCGLTCSYNDVRELMTALAKEKINTENNVYIPSCIKKVDESKKYIYASMDIGQLRLKRRVSRWKIYDTLHGNSSFSEGIGDHTILQYCM